MTKHWKEVIAALLVVLIIVVLFKPKESLQDKRDKAVLKKQSVSHINGRWLGKQGEFLQLRVFVPSLSYKKDGLKTAVRFSKWSVFSKDYVSELIGSDIVILKDAAGKAVLTVKVLDKKNIQTTDTAGVIKVYSRQASHLDKLTTPDIVPVSAPVVQIK